jgi:hypothetical protein
MSLARTAGPQAGSHLLLKREPRPPRGQTRADEREATDEDSGKVLVCAECLQAVTTRAAQIEMSGSHAHTFANPHGLVFRIGCFAVAPGCQEASEASTEFTWFPGYAWQVATCRGCAGHLGWLFRSTDSRFHGLILDRLAEMDEAEH